MWVFVFKILCRVNNKDTGLSSVKKTQKNRTESRRSTTFVMRMQAYLLRATKHPYYKTYEVGESVTVMGLERKGFGIEIY